MSTVQAIPQITHWTKDIPREDGRHGCYFCNPSAYDPMPYGCTICARCGVLIWTGRNDPMNESMLVCPRCDESKGEEGA